MRRAPLLEGAALAVLGPWVAVALLGTPVPAQTTTDRLPEWVPPAVEEVEVSVSDEIAARLHVKARAEKDFEAMRTFRPGFSFWQHIFVIPDGSIVFGSKEDGRLLATFPGRGDWERRGRWEDESLAGVLEGQPLEDRVGDRREQVAALLESAVGPVQHNPTRGDFLLPNARRYGSFLADWSAIYERFGVPSEIGLAQAILESGLNGKIRSSARAIGFCQWLPRNWERLKKQASSVIEAHNQTTQAAYCAAYLTVLATKYGTFIPALSEHHSGGANVGRTVINGVRLGGGDVREQYLMGSAFQRDLRNLSPQRFKDVYRSYGPRSFLYAEMVFGNTFTVESLRERIPQERIHAMRARRNIPLAEITRRTGLSTDEVRRFNPALVRQVPAGATLYLPVRMEEFGKDVSFWHRPPSDEYSAVLNDFVRLEVTPDEWEHPSFQPVLRSLQRRFRETGTEEGDVMAAVLGYAMQEMTLNRRVLAEYRDDPRIQGLFEEGVREREATSTEIGRGR